MHVSSLIVEERVVLFRDLVPEVGAKFPWGEQVTNFQPPAQIVHLFMYFRASVPQHKIIKHYSSTEFSLCLVQ